jgi:hypothetical protein
VKQLELHVTKSKHVTSDDVQGLYPEVGHFLHCAPSKDYMYMSRNFNTCILLASIRRLPIARSS